MRRVRGGLAGLVSAVLVLGSGGALPVPEGAGWFSVGAVGARGWFRDVVWPGPWQEREPAPGDAAAAADPEPVPGPFDESRVSYGSPAVRLERPRVVHATGAELSWSESAGVGAVEYQVHRGSDPTFRLSAGTLVATVPGGTGGYADTTAREDLRDPYAVDEQPVYYRVAARTTGGRLLASPVVRALLPAPGRVARLAPAAGHGMLTAGGQARLLREVSIESTAAGTYYAPELPQRMRVGSRQSVPVVVTNTSDHPWPAGSTSLSYWWRLPDGTDITTGANQSFTPLPQDLAPGASVTVPAQVQAPEKLWTGGNAAEGYTLAWDMYDASIRTWKSASHQLPQLPQNVRVDDPSSDLLGLERFYQYAGRNTGAGSTVMTNVYAGNAVWSYNAFNHPSRGVGTFVRLAYNSLDTSDSPLGFGWSLQTSTVQQIGTSLRFHPPGKEWPEQVRLVDGDGTTQVFLLDTHGLDVKDCTPETCDFIHPRGVHLYLQRTGSADPQRAWRMTRPDRTVFFFDTDGYQSAAVDRNGNTMSFGYDERRSNNRPTKFLRTLTDADARRTLSVDYYQKGETYTYVNDEGVRITEDDLTNPHIIDKIQSITDISGDPLVGGTVPERTLAMIYTDEGLLAELTDGAGSPQAKVFEFAYDPEQGNKNVKLLSVTDPRGNATSLDYYLPSEGDDPRLHWRAETITDRIGGVTRFDYTDPDGPQGSELDATVTDVEGNPTAYHLDGFGRPTRVVNALGQTTRLTWDADNNVVELVEDNGAATTWVYDEKTGYPLEMTGAEANANGTPGTVLTYQTSLNGFVADLVSKSSPEGRTWTFGYDAVGNLTSVTDPKGTVTPEGSDFTTVYTYDALGQMRSARDANGHTTFYDDYHPVGYPRTITDPLDNPTRYVYDARGEVTSVTDAKGKTTTQGYDLFGRPGELREPKDTEADPPVFIVTPAPTYDDNDNAVESTAPNGAVGAAVFDADDRLRSVTLPGNSADGPERVASYTYDRVGNLLTETEPLGNLTPADPADFVTRHGYDAIYQQTSIIDAAGGVATFVYDSVGNLVTETDARKNATPDPDDYTAKYTYDLNHRKTAVIDPLGHTSRFEYDRDGKTIATIDPDGNRSSMTLDERGLVTEVEAPHTQDGGAVGFRTTRYEYDQVGNRTKVITPRGVETTDVADDFVEETVYDELNRIKEELSAFDPNDPRHGTPDRTSYEYDEVSNLVRVSAPPSEGQTVRNDTTYTHFDNGWVRSSTDPWGIVTRYDHDELGSQTARTVTGAGGSSGRTQTWTYFPDGELASRSDDGVPVGSHVVLVDNSDTQHARTVGIWETAADGERFQGFDHRSNQAGTGADTFTWRLVVPTAGRYEAFVRYPDEVTGAATDAPYTVTHSGGETVVRVDQTQRGGEWVSLGSFDFGQGIDHSVALSDDATGGTVFADAVKLVRDNSGDVDDEAKTFTYTYDANGNQTGVTDTSSGARVDEFAMSYDVLNRLTTVEELDAGVVQNTTSYTYDANGNPLSYLHDRARGRFEYDPRGLISRATTATSASDPDPRVTTFTYTPRSETEKVTKANGNRVEVSYYLDGLVRNQVERKPDGTVVSDHTLEYTANSEVAKDTSSVMNADDHADHLNNVYTYTYDPRDRIAEVSKTGDTSSIESYIHDANNNVVEQTVDGVATTHTYDRNRLQSASSNGVTTVYNYDPFGRLDTVIAAGTVVEDYAYDGFDRIQEHRTPSTTTRYTYDPFDRTASRTENAGTAESETTDLLYLGMDPEVIAEEVAGEVRQRYAFSGVGGAGRRLSTEKTDDDGTTEDLFYSYHPMGDVEALTDSDGNTQDTYGYTAYGSDDADQFTGNDQPDPADPEAEPDNVYRFNAKRFDPAAGTYDMGFRDYSPGLNRFLTRDLFNGALSDMSLAFDPFTGNRYAFGGGNPISFIEATGHWGFSLSDIGHAALDVAGLVPVVGEVADVANGIWYAAEGNYVDAGLSFASAIPFAGYAATAAKATRYGARALDAVQTATRHGDNLADVASGVSRTGDDVADASRAAPGPRDTSQGTPRADRDAPSCPIRANSFTPGTEVLMADGTPKPIEAVRRGERVLATDPVTGGTRALPVVAVITGRGAKTLVEVTVDADRDQQAGGTIVATDDHPFWVDNYGGWIHADNLRPGDRLHTPSGGVVEVVATVRDEARSQRVHNLTVAGIHTYYVTVAGLDLLTHNAGCDEPSDELLDYADSQIGRADVAAEVTSAGGARGYGVNTPRAPEDLTPNVRTATEATKHHRGCAEIGALCDLESQGASIGGARPQAVHVTGGSRGKGPELHGTPKELCPSCQRLFRYLEDLP